MTIEEPFERIEHVTAGIGEERRRDREEYKQLWRDTQRRSEETSAQIQEMSRKIIEVDERLGKRIEQIAEEMKEGDRRLGERIDTLVSAIGALAKLVSKPGPNGSPDPRE